MRICHGGCSTSIPSVLPSNSPGNGADPPGSLNHAQELGHYASHRHAGGRGWLALVARVKCRRHCRRAHPRSGLAGRIGEDGGWTPYAGYRCASNRKRLLHRNPSTRPTCADCFCTVPGRRSTSALLQRRDAVRQGRVAAEQVHQPLTDSAGNAKGGELVGQVVGLMHGLQPFQGGDHLAAPGQ